MSRALDALLARGPLSDGVTARLDAPRVGVFRPAVQRGDAVSPGRRIGRLTVLGRAVDVVAPPAARGVLRWIAEPGPVGYGAELAHLGAIGESGVADPSADAANTSADGYAVRAPIDGIFYCRPSPDAPAYVVVGGEVTAGQAVGLIEVMKTFNPVSLGGAGAPARGRVLSIEAADAQEVAAGDVLLRISPL